MLVMSRLVVGERLKWEGGWQPKYTVGEAVDGERSGVVQEI